MEDEIRKRILDLEIKLLRLEENKLNSSRSTELKDLFGSLAKAQEEMNTAGLNASNPFFKSKYADLAEIVKASRPALTKHGLSVIQQIMPNEHGEMVLHTILAHNSGQWIETRMKINPTKPDVQTLGSYISYIRRYSYAALVGVVVCNEDDDGEVAAAPERNTPYKEVYKPKEIELITPEQLQELHSELEGHLDIAQMVLSGLKIQKLADVPKTQYSSLMKRIREIKHKEEQTKQ